MKIGVFDSGVGGAYVTKSIKIQFPDAVVIVKQDKQNLPYGTKTKDQLLKLVLPILKSLQNEGCDIIVIACNTVTTTIISDLRNLIKIPLVGIEPMIKPAAKLTKTGKITVCATPATLASDRYTYLKNKFADGIEVLEPDCSDWASMIEANSLDKSKISSIVDRSKAFGSDIIVLGCTHYHWIYETTDTLSGPEVTVLQPTDAVTDQLKRVISQLG